MAVLVDEGSASYEVLTEGDQGVARAIHVLLEGQTFVHVDGTVSLGMTNDHINSNNDEHGF